MRHNITSKQDITIYIISHTNVIKNRTLDEQESDFFYVIIRLLTHCNLACCTFALGVGCAYNIYTVGNVANIESCAIGCSYKLTLHIV